MKVVITNLLDVKPFERDTALCLGFFDGVHRGHQALIEMGKKSGLELAVLTFDRSPKSKMGTPLLSTVADRLAIFEAMGVSVTLLVIFDEQVKALSAEKFIETLNSLKVKKVYCGPDFRFGHKASGDAQMLKYGLGRNFTTVIVDEVEQDHAKISSSRIIKHLHYGNINTTNKMLGRPYSIKGTVVKGKGNGRKFGYPTANLSLSANYVLPLNGVYATAIQVNGKRYYSMTSVGYHPTVEPVEQPLVEVHIFNFNKRIYKQHVVVEFLQFMRPELAFESVSQLIDKMQQDEREILALKNSLFK